MPKYLIYPSPDRKPVVKYERRTENMVNGKLEPVYEEDRTMTRAPDTKFTWSVSQSRKLGGHLKTGLLDYVENIYKDEANFRTPEWEEILKGKDKVTRQTLLEYKHGHAPGYYTNIIDVRILEKDPKDIRENFFQTKMAYLNLNDGVTILDTDTNPIHEVLYYGMLESDLIANSYRELTPDTLYYIAQEQEEEERKALKSRKRNGAIAKLEELVNKNDGTVLDFAKVLNVPKTKKISMSAERAYSELDKFIKNASDQQIDEFSNTYSMWKSPESKRRFKAFVLLSDAMDSGVVWKKNNVYTWQPPRDENGKVPVPIDFNRESEIIEFLSEVKYQAEQELIRTQINAKLRI